ncbi:MAG: class I SAM-dependent methyltransferase [Burkholderiales bacterium]
MNLGATKKATTATLSVIVVIESDREAEAASREWHGFLHTRAIPSEVLIARTADFGSSIADQLQRASGEYLLVVFGSACDRAGEWFPRLWEQRAHAGMMLAGHSRARRGLLRSSGPIRRLALRASQRLLSLPVLPDAGVVLCRRAALNRLPEAVRPFEWLLEAIVLANSDGWPVHRHAGLCEATLEPIGLGPRALWRLWVLRNSALSADYDERAFNSIIPLQRYWHRRRHEIINGFVDSRTRILDVGCGSSRIVQDLPNAVGLDVQIKKLRRISPRTHKVVQATLTRLPFKSGSFDTLICSQVIEHVPEPLVDWREMNRVLTPGGTLVVGTPDYATLAWPVLERLYGIVHPKGYVHEHINHYTAASLDRALASHGFEPTARAYVGRGELIVRARKI